MNQLLLKNFDKIPQADECVAFDIQSISDWYWTTQQSSFDTGDWPALVPPYPYLWMEYSIPSRWRVGESLQYVPKNLAFDSIGCWARCHEIDESKRETAISDGYINSIIAHRANGDWVDVGDQVTELIEESKKQGLPRWVAIFNTYANFHHESRFLHWGSECMYLNDSGKMIARLSVFGKDTEALIRENEYTELEFQNYTASFTIPFLFATSLMHCKNVEQVDSPINPGPKRILKSGVLGLPTMKYRILTIDGVLAMKKSTSSGNLSVSQALHFVRGHFKDFTESGLFGKHKGIYWWDHAAKGDHERGVVDKDYRVKPKNNPTL